MSMLSVLIKDLVEKTTLEDGTYLVAGNTDANKITFLNLVNAIKKKLGLDNLKWTDWVNLGSAMGVSIKYRYTAYEVELLYSGTFEKKVITGGSAGYAFPALPDGLNPRYNVDHSIYACAGNNAGAITLQCYPTGTPNTFKITSHKTITVEPEYVCGYFRYTRN